MIPKNPTIGARLSFSYGAVSLLMILLTALAMARVGEIQNDLDHIEDNKVKLRYAAELRGSVHGRATALRDVVLASDAAVATAPINLIKTLDDSYARSAEPLDTLFKELPGILPEEKEALAAIKTQEHRARPLISRVTELHAAGQREEAGALLAQQAAPAMEDWLATVNRFIDLEQKRNEENAASARRTTGGFSGWMALLCAIAIGAVSLVAWYLGRGLDRLGQAESAAQATAAELVRADHAPDPAREKIAGIIGAIDGIAFQSHILALNAAVEAARAGEEGRECAVEVAEVRELARRSAEAAHDIRELVGQQAERVAAGA